MDIYPIVKKIVKNNKIRDVLAILSYDNLALVCFLLENRFYYLIYDLFNSLSIANPDIIVSSFVTIYNQYNHQSINIYDVLVVSKSVINQSGGIPKFNFSDSNKNIIMRGISVTLRSFLDRKVDKQHIDNNLRQGVIDRKKIANKNFKHKNIKYKKDKQKITTEVSMNPKNKGKHIIHSHENTVVMPSRTTLDNYRKGVDKLNKIDPKNLMDLPLSPPLDEEPVGISGSTIITQSSNSIIKNKI